MDLQKAQQALINAHNAGDVESAKKIAAFIKSQSQQQLQQDTTKTSIPRAAWEGIKQGTTFGLGDEFQAGIAAATAYPFTRNTGMDFGDLYNMQLEQNRAEIAQAKQDRPVTSFASEVLGGGLTGGAAASRIGGKALATQMAQAPIRTSAGLGGVSGGIYGFGTGEGGVEERLGQAGIGSVFGVLGGAAGGALGSRLGALTSKKSSAAGAVGSQNIDDAIFAAREGAQEIAAPTITGHARAASKIEKALKADYPENFEQVLASWRSGDLSLAEIGGRNTQRLMRGVAQYGPGEAQTFDFFEDRLADSGNRILKAINKNVNSDEMYYATLDDMLAAGRKVAKPIYKEAFDINKSLNSNQLNRVLNAPAAKKALKEVAQNTRNRLQYVAKPDPELTALAKDLEKMGKMQATPGGVSGGLPLRVLDAVKKRLDAQINTISAKAKAMNATQPEMDTLRSLTFLKNELVSEIDNLDKTGLYKKAREKAGDYLRNQEAMELGRVFDKTDPEILERTLRNMGEAEKNAFKVGVGKKLRDVLGSTTDGRNPRARIMGNPTARERLMKVLSPEQYKNLEKTIKAEDQLFKIRNDVLGGSNSIPKAMAAADVAAGGAEAIEMLATQNPRGLGVAAIRTAIGKLYDGVNDDTANAIAKIIYATDPQEKLNLLQNVSKNKSLTGAQKQAVKRMYFEIENGIKLKREGAAAGGVFGSSLANQEVQ